MIKRVLWSLVFVLICATSAGAHPHQWCWDAYTPEQIAQWEPQGYRVRWTVATTVSDICWHPVDYQEIDIITSCQTYPKPEDIGIRCCDGGLTGLGENEPVPGDLIFFVITAFNVFGESSIEHGEIDPICP